jgi:hypothetical protein
MNFVNDLRLLASFRGRAVRYNQPESESVPADSADGANWESAWIDLGGEG